METKQKSVYEAPLTGVFEVKAEGVICGSDALIQAAGSPTYNGFTTEETW